MRLTSFQNPRVKRAIKLRQRRARDQQQKIIIDGERAIRYAIDSGVAIEELFLSEAHYYHLTPEQSHLLQACQDQGLALLVVAEPLMQRIGYGRRSDQWVATAEMPRRSLSSLSLPSNPAVAILEGVEKPGNVGAVARSADAAGIDAIVLADASTDLFNPNAIRASLGTVFTASAVEATIAEVLAWLQQQAIQPFVARVDAETRYDQYDYRQATALVLGSEAKGVSRCWCDSRWRAVRLPMCGRADSLNVSSTAAVLFYEVLRQRQLGRG